jgi:metallo-beta-lactamase class B
MSAKVLLAMLLFAASGSAPSLAQPTKGDAQARWARQCKDWDDWDKPSPPFQVSAGTYYVGTCGIAAILVVGDQGDVLIDGGPANAGDLVAANIRALGIKLSDVKILLHTHEHNDHAGGLARLKKLTGARLYASSSAAQALATGSPSPDDPQFGEHQRFPAVRVDRVLDGNATVTLGGLTLKGFATPGHTAGAMSWQWQSCAGNACRTVVYADSLTPVSSDGYRFTDHPEALAAFRGSLITVGSLKCDILLSPHPSASHMRDRLLAGSLVNPRACWNYADGLKKQLDERLAKEANGR